MKIRIKTHNGELPSYLTVGKVYDVIDCFDNRMCTIQSDINSIIWASINCCTHLNGGSWEIVNE